MPPTISMPLFMGTHLCESTVIAFVSTRTKKSTNGIRELHKIDAWYFEAKAWRGKP